jgi:TfoX/Sxy family transcriptional regulator of competence genes
MATRAEFASHVVDLLALGARVDIKKMFGEYALYIDTKVVALLCDDQVFVKPTEAVKARGVSLPEGEAYPGSKPYWQADELLDDPEILRDLLLATAAALPLPKPKKPKSPATPKRAKPKAVKRRRAD